KLTFYSYLQLFLFFVTLMVQTSLATVQPKAPNFQYFERCVENIIKKYIRFSIKLVKNNFYYRPKYRYPYYDEHGRGKLLYGYGGPELYQYKTYTPLEGIH
ncbi:hypothetical protein KR026_002883, partial [Drosophila bipectinata]